MTITNFKKANLYSDIKTNEQKVVAWDKFVANQNKLTDRYNVKRALTEAKVKAAKIEVSDVEYKAELKRLGLE